MDLAVFNTSHQIRIADVDGTKRLSAVDACRALGYAQPRQDWHQLKLRNPELAELSVVVRLTTTDGKRYDSDTLDITGVSMLCLLARTELAREFRRWAAPILAERILRMPSHVEALEGWAAEMRRRIALEQETEELRVQTEELRVQADFAKRHEGGEGWLDLSTVAKELDLPGLGPNNLREWLTAQRFLTLNTDNKRVPQQHIINAHWMRLDTRFWEKPLKDESGRPLLDHNGKQETAQVIYHVIQVSPVGVQAIHRAWRREQDKLAAQALQA